MEETKTTKVTNEQIMEHLILQEQALMLITNSLGTLITHSKEIDKREKAIAWIALGHMVDELATSCGFKEIEKEQGYKDFKGLVDELLDIIKEIAE